VTLFGQAAPSIASIPAAGGDPERMPWSSPQADRYDMLGTAGSLLYRLPSTEPEMAPPAAQ